MGRVLDLYLGPKGLPVVVVDAVDEIEDDVAFAALRMTEGVFMDSDSGSGCESGLYVIVVKSHFVKSRAGALGRVAEPAAETAVRIVSRAGIEFQRTSRGHDQDVSQIGVASAAEMGVAESDDCGIVVTVAGAGLVDHRLVFPINTVGDRVGVRTELDSTEGHAGPGKGVSHAVCADERIHIACFRLGRDREG